MAFKLIESAQERWRAVNAPHLVALVRAGALDEDRGGSGVADVLPGVVPCVEPSHLTGRKLRIDLPAGGRQPSSERGSGSLTVEAAATAAEISPITTAASPTSVTSSLRGTRRSTIPPWPAAPTDPAARLGLVMVAFTNLTHEW